MDVPGALAFAGPMATPGAHELLAVAFPTEARTAGQAMAIGATGSAAGCAVLDIGASLGGGACAMARAKAANFGVCC